MQLQQALPYLIIGLLIFIIGYLIGIKIQKLKSSKEFEEKIPEIREDAIKKSRAVLSGQFSEQLAPYLPDFPYKPNEARFIGKPIDFIIFKGMDDKKIDEVVFVEVKSGGSRISPVERSLKEAVESKKVMWNEYRIPEGITKNKDNLHQ